jgi:hypothetical protein
LGSRFAEELAPVDSGSSVAVFLERFSSLAEPLLADAFLFDVLASTGSSASSLFFDDDATFEAVCLPFGRLSMGDGALLEALRNCTGSVCEAASMWEETTTGRGSGVRR